MGALRSLGTDRGVPATATVPWPLIPGPHVQVPGGHLQPGEQWQRLLDARAGAAAAAGEAGPLGRGSEEHQGWGPGPLSLSLGTARPGEGPPGGPGCRPESSWAPWVVTSTVGVCRLDSTPPSSWTMAPGQLSPCRAAPASPACSWAREGWKGPQRSHPAAPTALPAGRPVIIAINKGSPAPTVAWSLGKGQGRGGRVAMGMGEGLAGKVEALANHPGSMGVAPTAPASVKSHIYSEDKDSCPFKPPLGPAHDLGLPLSQPGQSHLRGQQSVDICRAMEDSRLGCRMVHVGACRARQGAPGGPGPLGEQGRQPPV